MRHKKTTAKLSLKAAPRKALLRGLATSFALNGKLETTLVKAKALRSVVEKLITASRVDTLATRRKLIKYLYDEKAINKMLKEIAPKYKDRKGGYTRIIKLPNRKGDNSAMAIIELV
jgi:large subunit ribosomal protein L17